MNYSGLAGIAAAVAMVALAGCTTSGTEAPGGEVEDFAISSVSVSPMTTANLCSALGGQGAAPTITISHSAVAGVPIRIRMYDNLSDGSTYNHRSTRVQSDASGKTVVDHKFLPPCNTTGGRLNSIYRFDVKAGGESRTVTWARFNSGTRTISQ